MIISIFRSVSVCRGQGGIKLKVPPTYMIPVFIGIGYADPEEPLPELSRTRWWQMG